MTTLSIQRFFRLCEVNSVKASLSSYTGLIKSDLQHYGNIAKHSQRSIVSCSTSISSSALQLRKRQMCHTLTQLSLRSLKAPYSCRTLVTSPTGHSISNLFSSRHFKTNHRSIGFTQFNSSIHKLRVSGSAHSLITHLERTHSSLHHQNAACREQLLCHNSNTISTNEFSNVRRYTKSSSRKLFSKVNPDGTSTVGASEIISFSPTKYILDSSPKSVQPYLRLIRFDKPIGTWLLYWPCTWSIAMAAQPGSFPDLHLLALFGAGAFFMRGAGCIINDMWDKDFDAKVARTRQRPLAAGEVTQFQALVFLGTQLSCALAVLLQLNVYSIVLGAASMGLVISYPLAKRFTYWPQIMLGFTFNYGALLGWAAVRGSVDWSVCLPLYTACILWTIVYDTIYAHQDKYDDMLIGVKSTAIKLGAQTKPYLSGFTIVMTASLLASGYMCDMTWPYYAAVAITGVRLGQQIYSVDLDDADQCANAFCGNFYLGAVMFGGIILANYLKAKAEEAEKPGWDGRTVKEIFEEELKSDKKDIVIRV